MCVTELSRKENDSSFRLEWTITQDTITVQAGPHKYSTTNDGNFVHKDHRTGYWQRASNYSYCSIEANSWHDTVEKPRTVKAQEAAHLIAMFSQHISADSYLQYGLAPRTYSHWLLATSRSNTSDIYLMVLSGPRGEASGGAGGGDEVPGERLPRPLDFTDGGICQPSASADNPGGIQGAGEDSGEGQPEHPGSLPRGKELPRKLPGRPAMRSAPHARADVQLVVSDTIRASQVPRVRGGPAQGPRAVCGGARDTHALVPAAESVPMGKGRRDGSPDTRDDEEV
ncbi:hypothetical protein V501_02018 [Pseudogymnoascus sp. VKM F-4519 (FW-2642)]|nr:hypothetical protein V501_02018 [Pseudogymnoascus sp. VKM F-4519 (FW-2642)]